MTYLVNPVNPEILSNDLPRNKRLQDFKIYMIIRM